MHPSWSEDAAIQFVQDRVGEPAEEVARRLARFLEAVSEIASIDAWTDGEDAWPSTRDEQAAFVAAHPDRGATGDAVAEHGVSVALRGTRGSLRPTVSVRAGDGRVGRRAPLQVASVSVLGGTGWTPQQATDILLAGIEAFAPRFANARSVRATMQGGRGNWLAPDAHRLWLRDDVARVDVLADGFAATPHAGGVLVTADDDLDVEALLEGWAAVRAANGIGSLAPASEPGA